MTWPTNKPDATKFDNANDSIAESRTELNTMATNLNDIIDFIDVSGITDGQGLIYDSASGTLKAGSVATGLLSEDYIEVGDQSTLNTTIISPGRYGKSLTLAGGVTDSVGGGTGLDTPYININGYTNSNIALFCPSGGTLQINGNAVSFSTPAGYAGSVIGYWQVIVPGYAGTFAYIELKR